MTGRYRHYKGKVYRVLGIAHSTKDTSTTSEPLVIYTREDPKLAPFWWACPYDKFHASVEYDNELVKRFVELEEPEE